MSAPDKRDDWVVTDPGDPNCDHYYETTLEGVVLVRSCRLCSYAMENEGTRLEPQAIH